jgi:hypothetical protein
MHPLDLPKVRRLTEALYDVSAGRRLTRAGLEHQVEMLMLCLRGDCCAAGAGDVLDSLLATVDDHFGVERIERRVIEAVVADRQAPLCPCSNPQD